MVRRRARAVSNHPSRRGPLPSLRRQRTLACVAAPLDEVSPLNLSRLAADQGDTHLVAARRAGLFSFRLPHPYLTRSHLPCRPAGSFSALSSFSCFSLLPPTTGWSR